MASRCSVLFLIVIIVGFGTVIQAHPNPKTPLPFVTEEDFARAAVPGLKYDDSLLNYTRFYGQDYNDEGAQTKLAGRYPDWKWRNARVPYTLDPKLSESERGHVAGSFKEYQSKTCVRFVPKENSDTDYVDILRDDRVCGLSALCRAGGRQEVKFGGNCVNSGQLNHELGHTLCFLHEEQRPDRDDYISWDKSKCSPASKVNPKDWTTLDIFYDYLSLQHSEQECYEGCINPKLSGVTKCGSGGHLSVLDVEKINAYYECPDCHSYRFRPKTQINFSSSDRLLQAGHDLGGDQDKLYICRAYFNGDIIPGKADPHGSCYIPYNGGEHKMDKDFELFTNPQDVDDFRWERHGGGRSAPANAIVGGRTARREPLYIGRCELTVNDRKTVLPGKFNPEASEYLYVPFGGGEKKCEDFELLVC